MRCFDDWGVYFLPVVRRYVLGGALTEFFTFNAAQRQSTLRHVNVGCNIPALACWTNVDS